MLQLRKFLPLVVSFGVFSLVGHVFAAPPEKAGKARVLDTWRKSIESGDEARILAALDEIAEAKDPKAAPSVELLLTRGSSARVTLKALNLVGQLEQGSSSAAVVPYASHRDGALRRAALEALTHTKGSAAVAAIRATLRGPDADLRGPAARALGTLGAREALPDLFTALPKGVPDAATSIGELCTPDDCKRLIELVGKLPFDTLQNGVDPMLFRNDVPDDFKVIAIERLRGLQTKSAGEFLKDVLARWPKKGSAKVRASLEAAVDAMRGAVR